MKKLVLETTAPFQGLPELVAYNEGLFEQEGLIVEWADREKDVDKRTEINVISPKGLDPFSSHGKLLEQGQADMYNHANGGTTAASRIPGPVAASSAAAASSPMPRSQFDRTRPSTPPSSWRAAPSACRSISAPIISPSTCWKGSCHATRSRSAARPMARATGSMR